MYTSIVTRVILLLSVFSTALAFIEAEKIHVVRQIATVPNTPQCNDYSRTANFSTIAINSTYRAAFLQASPVGTMYNADMLDLAKARLPPMTRDINLNNACGNLTTVAFNEAMRNFSAGIIAQFTFTGNPQAVRNGPELMVIFGVIAFFFTGVWLLSP